MTAPAILQSSRIPFLVLGPACVFLGIAIALQQNADLSAFRAFLVILAAVLAHASVNLLNEYQDFRSGLDLNTQRTPFSGGSGALPAEPHKAQHVLLAGWVSFALTAAIGTYLLFVSNWTLLLLGLPGLVLIASYTPWINRSAWLCLIAPGLGFGVFMVLGTVIALGGAIDSNVALFCVAPFALINNLLLLNQFPDLKADQQAGRKHLIIRYGVSTGLWVYAVNLLLAVAAILALLHNKQLPASGALLLLMLGPGVFSLTCAIKKPQQLSRYPAALAANVVIAVFIPVLLAVTLLLGQ